MEKTPRFCGECGNALFSINTEYRLTGRGPVPVGIRCMHCKTVNKSY